MRRQYGSCLPVMNRMELMEGENEMSMKRNLCYRWPDYYTSFTCAAGECPDTCCTSWVIPVDHDTWEKYRKIKGPFGRELRNTLNRRTHCLKSKNNRCLNLQEDGLCRIQQKMGAEFLCSACRRYPRHMEIYGNRRELSLSLSCPEVARMLFTKRKSVHFLERSSETGWQIGEGILTNPILLEVRDTAIKLAQQQDWQENGQERVSRGSCNIAMNMSMVLAFSHDVQVVWNRCRRRRPDMVLEEAVRNVIHRYTQRGAARHFAARLEEYGRKDDPENQVKADQCLTAYLEIWRHLKPVNSRFQMQIQALEQIAYDAPEEAVREFNRHEQSKMIGYEQIFLYFLDTWYLGAVYDGDIFNKARMAAVCILVLRELAQAAWLQEGKQISLSRQIELIHCFARELEHSDQNLELLEAACASNVQPWFCLENLLISVLERFY